MATQLPIHIHTLVKSIELEIESLERINSTLNKCLDEGITEDKTRDLERIADIEVKIDKLDAIKDNLKRTIAAAPGHNVVLVDMDDFQLFGLDNPDLFKE